MNALDDLADASFDAGCVPEVSNVFSTLSNDHTSVLCAD